MAATQRIRGARWQAGRRGFTLIELPVDRLGARRARNPGAPGFTLIELLVVIAIIALLVSILVPSLMRAKRIAQMVKCAAHVYAFGEAAHMYAADEDGWAPRHDVGYRKQYNHLFWAVAFAPYLRREAWEQEEFNDLDTVKEWVYHYEFFRCPGMKAGGVTEGLDYTVNNFDWEAYAWNVRHGRADIENPYKRTAAMNLGEQWPAVRVGRIRVAPAELLYICEASRRFGIRVADLHHDSHCVFNRDGRPAGGRMIKPKDLRHNGKTVFACFDGHTETREMTPENFPMGLYIPNHQ